MAGQDFTPIWKLNRAGVFLNAMDVATDADIPAHRHHGSKACQNVYRPSAEYAANTRSYRWPAWAIAVGGASTTALLVAVIFI